MKEMKLRECSIGDICSSSHEMFGDDVGIDRPIHARTIKRIQLIIGRGWNWNFFLRHLRLPFQLVLLMDVTPHFLTATSPFRFQLKTYFLSMFLSASNRLLT